MKHGLFSNWIGLDVVSEKMKWCDLKAVIMFQNPVLYIFMFFLFFLFFVFLCVTEGIPSF